MKKLKYSRQRESIKSFLATRKDHPTADTIYEELRDAFPNISLGTVYRNLALLESLGSIVKITSASGADRYDSNTKLHHHFTCLNCQRVIDLEMDCIDHIKDVASKQFDGAIESYNAHFYGLCAKCQ